MKTVSLFLFVFFMYGKSRAQSGTLDISFGTGGYVINNIGSFSVIGDVVVQPDAKVVVAGMYLNGANGFDFALARYNYNGSLDNTFGIGGIATTVIGNSFGGLNSIVLQPDGKIVVSGYIDGGSNDDIAVARYNTNGTLDNSFGTGGIAITAIDDFDDNIWDMVIQPDGKILVAGSYNGTSTGFNTAIALVRYNTNGTLDNSFGTGGKVTTRVGAAHTRSKAMALQPDGKIVVCGQTDIDNGPNYEDFIILRYNSNGTLDNSFDTDGMVIFGNGFNARDEMKSILVKPDGKIVAVGQFNNLNTQNRLEVCQLNTNGSFDNSFGTNGIVITDPAAIDYSTFSDASLQPDNKILVSGFLNTTIPGSLDFIMYRYLPGGALDNTFGTNGKVITTIRLWNTANCITLSNNRIYLAGSSTNDQFNANQQFTVAAYKNCSMPTLVSDTLPVTLCKGSSFMGNSIVADTSISDTLQNGCLYDSAIKVYRITISNADTTVSKDSTVCYGSLYKGRKVFSSFFDADTVLAPHSCGTRKFINKIRVTVTPEIKNGFGKDTSICSNGKILLTAHQPALSYLWQDNSKNASFTVTAPGIYWVEVTDTFRCTARDSVNVLTSDLFLHITTDTTVLPQQTVLLTPQTNGTITWTANPTLSCSICQSTVASPFTTTAYFLSAVKNGCTINASVKITVSKSVYLYVPTAFTPNKDNLNDIFKPATNITGAFLLQVYNRYGEEVFTSTNPLTGWNGRYKGKEQPNGAYIYIIHYQETVSAATKQIKGEIMLIR